MKKSTFNPLLFLAIVLLSFGINAQNALWTKASSAEMQTRQKEYRNSMPKDFSLFSLNTPALKTLLSQAPARNSGNSNVVISLPTNNGEIQSFRVFEASVMAPELQAAHPEIRSYVAQGVDDPSAIARFSVSSIGVNVMIYSPNYSTVYIDPYTKDKNFYITYNISSLPADPDGFVCMTEDVDGPELPLDGARNPDDGILRTFRLAVACNSKYSIYHLNAQGIPSTATDAVKKAAVLSAINTTMTRVNGVYEREVAVTMVLVPDEEDIIYLDAASDPYDPDQQASIVINQNQTVIDQEIGSANYDIGHLFSTGAGGLAQLRVPCTSSKARGVTGITAPIGDNYDIDYVSHEMGHQFGANHTFNGTTGSCGGGNRNLGTAYETGSGSTIMGYAGICGSQNVQSHSDDYFQAISITEIWNNITTGNSLCGVQSATNNLPPTADAGPDRYIPISTPFILEGIATDPNNSDVLSHCWEQMDNQSSTQPPVPSATKGPNFRSIDPLAVPQRYMPRISFVLANQLGGPGSTNKWEVLPSVERFLRFRYTVRDNALGGGASAYDNMVVNVEGDAGPFVVTSQNDPENPAIWQTQTTQTITWAVANTDLSPINCSMVNIMFSTNGGLEYPITVALNVPNNGSAVVNVPNVNTTAGRFMIKAANNIFYDINDVLITVQGPLANETFSFDSFAVYPNPSKGTFNLSFKPASNDNIQVSLYDLRGRLINQYNYDDVSASTMFSKQLDYGYIDSGMYFLVVKNGNKTTTKKLMKI